MKHSVLSGALAAVILSTPLALAPASAQYDQRSASRSDDQQSGSRWDSFKDDAGGLFGGLFGGGGDRQQGQGREGAGRGQGRGRPDDVAQMAPTDLTVRLDRLENQIRQLTGAIEQLQFRNQQLEQQVRRGQEDTEFRAQERGGATAARPRSPAPPPAQAAPPPPPQPGPPGTGRRSDAFDPNDNPSAPGVPRTLGSAASTVGTPSPIVTDEPQVGAPRGRQAGEPLDLATLSDRAANDPALDQGPPPRMAAAPPTAEPRTIQGALPPPRTANTGGQQMTMAPSNTPRDELAMAQGYIQRKDYALAEESLREFLKKYPSDRLVADAHYWMGETMYQRQRYRDAAESFLTISTKFDSNGRAPEALLRLGQSLGALGEKDAACATLSEVGRKYPRASNTVKQGVDRELKRARC